ADGEVENGAEKERGVEEAPRAGAPVGGEVHHIVGAEGGVDAVPVEVEEPGEEDRGEGGPADEGGVLIHSSQAFRVTADGVRAAEVYHICNYAPPNCTAAS